MQTETIKTKKGTQLKLSNIKGKPYLPVRERLIWFREENPELTFETELVSRDEKVAVVKATVRTKEGKFVANGYGTEEKAKMNNYVECAETSAIGRAFAHMGYGTEYAVELETDTAERSSHPVDSPYNATGGSFLNSNATHGNLDKVDPYNFVITFGKFKGKKASELPLSELENSYNYWTKRGETEKLSATLLAFVSVCKKLLDENVLVVKDSDQADDLP